MNTLSSISKEYSSFHYKQLQVVFHKSSKTNIRTFKLLFFLTVYHLMSFQFFGCNQRISESLQIYNIYSVIMDTLHTCFKDQLFCTVLVRQIKNSFDLFFILASQASFKP